MARCSKGKGCGASCIQQSHKCRKSLAPSGNQSVKSTRDLIKDLFGSQLGPKPEKAPQRLIVPGLSALNPADRESPSMKAALDDVSRLLKGESAQNLPLSRDVKSKGTGEVTRLQKALGLGELTRQEVGRDWQVLKDEAQRRKQELRDEIRKQQKLGTTKAKAKEKELQKELDKLNDALKSGESGKKSPVSQATKEARIGAKYFDQAFSPEKTVVGKQADYDWEGSARQGTNGKKGGFGSVLFQGDVVVKRGDLGENELEILRKVGQSGLGPQLIYGELGRRKETFAGVGIHDGRVAMTRVEGVEVGRLPSSKHVIGDTTAGDAYWKARADLHRLGVAHNDAHGDNVIVDGSGRPRFVDFGVSQDNPRAALSEAFGAIVNKSVIPPGAVIQGGMRKDLQSGTVRTSGILESPANQPRNLRQVYSNLTSVKAKMQRLGLSNDEIAQIMSSGIRNPESFYNMGVWGKLTNDQALDLITTLYNGI